MYTFYHAKVKHKLTLGATPHDPHLVFPILHYFPRVLYYYYIYRFRRRPRDPIFLSPISVILYCRCKYLGIAAAANFSFFFLPLDCVMRAIHFEKR